eukprot:c14658_g1_i3.p1 GENE.c14658_g1_i3~~c14658_g1_i3.p1  ORF type:complete len:511 (+),score=95.67 c14658_g1_i3:48-1535(+)
MSWFEMLREGKQALIDAVIRPPRADYTMTDLGPSSFEFCTQFFTRTDFIVENDRHHSLHCSWWRLSSESVDNRAPCVIYLHGNASCRVEAIDCLSDLLAIGVSVVSLDFNGCGLSTGQWVTLGAFEKEDLRCLVKYLRAQKVMSIALWGRSMGAVTALLYAETDPSMSALVLDSPFSDFTVLAHDIVQQGKDKGIALPSFITAAAIQWLRSQIRSRAHFDIRTLKAQASGRRCLMPAMFAHGAGDHFIPPKHTSVIQSTYAGDSALFFFEGDHQTQRPGAFFSKATTFLMDHLRISPSSTFSLQPIPSSPLPPWMRRSPSVSCAAVISLAPGTRVELQGLAASSGFNGRRGRVAYGDPNPEENRYVVNLDRGLQGEEEATVKVAGSKLRQLGATVRVMSGEGIQAKLLGKAMVVGFAEGGYLVRMEGGDGQVIKVEDERILVDVGTLVRVKGLKSAVQHNGQLGRVEDWSGPLQRYVVDTGRGTKLQIRPANILL